MTALYLAFHALPWWQASILAVVIFAAGSVLAWPVAKQAARRAVVGNVVGEAMYIGRELRRYGFLARGRIVEAAAETVKAHSEGRPIPELVSHRRDKGAPVLEGFIRAVRSSGRRVKQGARKFALPLGHGGARVEVDP